VQAATNTQKAAAQAAANQELANQALARLNTAAASFERAANRNWDSRLANPPQLPNVASIEDIEKTLNVSFPNSDVDLYDFDDEQDWVVAPTDGQ